MSRASVQTFQKYYQKPLLDTRGSVLAQAVLSSTFLMLRLMFYNVKGLSTNISEVVKDVFSVSDTGILGKRHFRVLRTGVEPMTFRLLLQMLYH